MFKKMKKHRLSLLLLAMVAMLSVYYVLMPEDDPIAPVAGGEGEVRYQDFAQMRLEILDERNSQVALFEEKIVDATVSMKDIEEYILEIETLTTLTEKEVFLEKVITTLGFEDSLVYLENDVVNVSVLADSFSVDEYIEIATIVKEEFGKNTLVVVNFINSSS